MALPAAREFAPAELEAATAFIHELPQEVRKVYVDVLEEVGWRFAYGDEPRHVPRILAGITRGRPFRVRSVDHLMLA